MNMDIVYKKVYDSGIDVFHHKFDCIKAITIEINKNYAIFLNPTLITDTDDEFYAVTHEYGHCKSGTTHTLGSTFDIIEQHEYRADRQAILDFLPIEQLEKAKKNGCKYPYEVAAFLNIPESFVTLALKHYENMGLM